MGERDSGETPEQIDAAKPKIITAEDVPTGAAEGEVVNTGPEFELPEQPAEPSVEQARANVDAAAPAEVTPAPTVQPRNTDVTGYKVDEHTGGHVSADQQRASADEYARAQGYPTSGEKAATRADQSKSGLRRFFDRFRGQ